MFLSHDQLLGLKVITKNGQVIGKLKDFEFDTDNFKITRYIISSSDLVKKITSQDLIINHNQIIEITAKTIIVDDNTLTEGEAIKYPASI
ncbi:MAG: hypothetical protein A3B89_01180 [Candidatus Buchananbacteria bacterium RIFCSPHIGHO2_02_FULL_40_13]|uniref:PRC-barrel domain-containing protein n=1 Tax=Candidatus Buchananbacteria bacterium RIFCSPLOWO2_01_FULL_39_33 TaxID=1797543 RepID=A0A1G1YJH1_9BACT|nr:MAG: hypothetical protein A3B89_01180 [Candidatus Buchananbacteria bacterium RIFCSPHIGHO2_02_FULL_40_13]OGY52485.1 MAG: hypothetical protein A3A02_03485 [Candidatus Buchananbacteria bacterium RIFCSPLOWO2_01_FULL_39_33]